MYPRLSPTDDGAARGRPLSSPFVVSVALRRLTPEDTRGAQPSPITSAAVPAE
jgi:hypothetical protein